MKVFTNNNIAKTITIELQNNIAEKIINGNSLHNIAAEFQLKLEKQNSLTKSYDNFDNDQQEFFKSLITSLSGFTMT